MPHQPRLRRRTLLASGAAALGASGMLARPAIAQAHSIRFTLPYLAQGTSLFPFVGKDRGFFSKRGIDIAISRGSGSITAAQSIAGGQFDFGMVISTPLILLIAKGLPLAGLATVDYDAMMGVGVLADSPIHAPRDLAGQKIGSVVASAEFPFFPVYAAHAGIDTQQINFVGVDPKLLERVLADGQVAAITGIASSSLPVLLSRGVRARWMLYSSAGLPTYGTDIVTSQDMLKKDPGLCGAMVDALMESLSFTLREPDQARDIFFRLLPEMGLNPAARSFIRIGMGLQAVSVGKPAARTHGLGWGDTAVYEGMTDLVMQYVAAPGTARPPVASWYSNRFAGNIRLSVQEWDNVAARAAEFRQLLA